MRVPAVILLSLFAVFAQQTPPPPPPPGAPPPRDVVPRRPAEPTGRGVIRGSVLASDTGNPIRRAMVSISPVTPPVPLTGTSGRGTPLPSTPTGVLQGRGVASPQGALSISRRQVTTDGQGAFEFTGLPAGSYRVTASPSQYSPQYLGMAYGAKKPGGPYAPDFGQPIQLTDGQAFDKVVIALPKGGVITGRVTDENADPLVRVQVYTMFFPPGSPRAQRMGSTVSTDDLGQFRVYGLQPGEYVVVAEARGNTFVQPNAPPETEEDKIGFMTTYYPGTADEGAAQRVRVRLGAETPGVEIRVVQGRLLRISGMVADSQGRTLARANGQLVRHGSPMGGGFGGFGFSTDEQGQFQMRNIPPGNYRLIVRETRQNAGPVGPGSQQDPGEAGILALTLAADLDNLLVTTSPGVTITGHVVFEQGPPSPMPAQMRVMAQFGNSDDGMAMPSPQPALVTPELTFTMKGLLGDYLLRTTTSGPTMMTTGMTAPSQYLKSVVVNGEDITDSPREFKNSDRVTITLTSRASIVEGEITDAKEGVVTEVGVIIFSDEKSLWRSNSTRTRRTTSDQAGHFRITGLMPGRYFIAAVPRDRLSIPNGADTAFFEQLAKEATSLVVGDDEQRRVDLKVLESGGQ